MSQLSANDIASLCLHDPNPQALAVQVQSTEHRIAILSRFTKYITRGAKVLELGCGQGDTTAVLAELVGDGGVITAVDPASLDYGAPYTLGQAQSHLSSGPLGSRIKFVKANPLEFLGSSSEKYDVTILSLCTWYFASTTVLASILKALADRTQHVLIAEWSLLSRSGVGSTHVLAALTQASLECRKPGETSESNVRTVLSPTRIKEAAATEGWHVQGSEEWIEPKANVLDGRWEVGAVRSKHFLQEVEEVLGSEREREKGVIFALRDAMLASLEAVGGMDKVQSMDVWGAVFGRT